jgi:hypothetical protein
MERLNSKQPCWELSIVYESVDFEPLEPQPKELQEDNIVTCSSSTTHML